MNRRELARNGRGRRAYYVYCREGMRPLELLKAIADAIACPARGKRAEVLKMIRLTLSGRPAVIAFDEAQHLDIACLETVRELLDLQRIGMVFMGSHELEHTFLRNAVHLEQWNSRFYAGATLPGITEQEASRILPLMFPGGIDGEFLRIAKRLAMNPALMAAARNPAALMEEILKCEAWSPLHRADLTETLIEHHPHECDWTTYKKRARGQWYQTTLSYKERLALAEDYRSKALARLALDIRKTAGVPTGLAKKTAGCMAAQLQREGALDRPLAEGAARGERKLRRGL